MSPLDRSSSNGLAGRSSRAAIVAAGMGMMLLCGCDLSYYPPAVPVYGEYCCDPYYAYDGWYDYGYAGEAYYYEEPAYYEDYYEYYGEYYEDYEDDFDFWFDFWYGDY